MKNNTQGFTLIELLIVIAIIGILAAVLIPNLLGARSRAKDQTALTCGKAIQTAQALRETDGKAVVTTASKATGDAAVTTTPADAWDTTTISACNQAGVIIGAGTITPAPTGDGSYTFDVSYDTANGGTGTVYHVTNSTLKK